MPLPQLEKTWEFDVNQTYAEGASPLATHQGVLRGIKDSLVGVLASRAAMASPWVVKRSSNGETFSDEDEDIWDTDLDLVFAADTTPHSWIVLEQAGISENFQICIDLKNADSNLLTVVWAPEGFPMTGTGIGDVSNRPFAATEVVLLNDAPWLGGQTTSQFRIHAMQSTDGQCTRIVGYWQAHAVLFWLFDRASRTVSGWSVPAVALVTGGDDTNLTYQALHSVATPNLWGYGTDAMTLWMATESFGSTLDGIGAKLVGANAFDLNWPLTPIGLASLTSLQAGRHGELVDLWFGPVAASHGDTYPGDGTKQLVQFGHLVFPWDGTSGDPGTTPDVA